MEKLRNKFTIITPLYNHLEYLPRLIQALEMQTFKDFEWIIADDGSDDGTKEYFKTLETPLNWAYTGLWFKRGMRLAKSVNNALKRATGDYIVFIMGDSLPEINYLELLNEWMDEDSVVCGVRVHIEGNKQVELDYRIRKGTIPKIPVLLSNEPWKYTTGNGLCVPRSALKKGWDTRFKGYGGDDGELVARLFYQGYLIWSVPQLLLYHNYHTNKESNPKSVKLLNKLIKQYAN